MNSTRRLFSILLLILAMFSAYLIVTNYKEVTTYVNKVIRRFSSNTVIVPENSINHRKYNYITVVETNNFEPHSKEDLKKIYYTVLNNGWNTFTFGVFQRAWYVFRKGWHLVFSRRVFHAILQCIRFFGRMVRGFFCSIANLFRGVWHAFYRVWKWFFGEGVLKGTWKIIQFAILAGIAIVVIPLPYWLPVIFPGLQGNRYLTLGGIVWVLAIGIWGASQGVRRGGFAKLKRKWLGWRARRRAEKALEREPVPEEGGPVAANSDSRSEEATPSDGQGC